MDVDQPGIVSGVVVPVLQRSWRPRSIGRHAATRSPRGHAIVPSTKRALPRPWKCPVEFSRCPQASAVLHPRSANRFSFRPSIRLLQIPRHTNDRTSHMDARLRNDIHIFHSLALIVGGRCAGSAWRWHYVCRARRLWARRRAGRSLHIRTGETP